MSPSLIEPGKPHIFLLRTPQEEKDHIRNCTKRAEAIAECDDIIDVLFQIVETKTLPPSALDLLTERTSSCFQIVYWQAGRRLVQLSHYFDAAGQRLLELMSSGQYRVRLRVVQSLWSDIPPAAITDSILRRGLGDRSSAVRCFAVDRIHMLRLSHLIPEIERLRQVERNEKVLSEIEFALTHIEQ